MASKCLVQREGPGVHRGLRNRLRLFRVAGAPDRWPRNDADRAVLPSAGDGGADPGDAGVFRTCDRGDGLRGLRSIRSHGSGNPDSGDQHSQKCTLCLHKFHLAGSPRISATRIWLTPQLHATTERAPESLPSKECVHRRYVRLACPSPLLNGAHNAAERPYRSRAGQGKRAASWLSHSSQNYSRSAVGVVLHRQSLRSRRA